MKGGFINVNNEKEQLIEMGFMLFFCKKWFLIYDWFK